MAMKQLKAIMASDYYLVMALIRFAFHFSSCRHKGICEGAFWYMWHIKYKEP